MALALSKFELVVAYIGARDVERTKTFGIRTEGVDIAAKRTNAIAAKVTILSALEAASDIFVQNTRFIEVDFDADAVPSSGLGNPYEEIVITVGLDAGGGKKATVSIPAPTDTLFVGDSGNTDDVDTADATLLAFIAEFKNDGTKLGTVSDGEQFEDPPNIYSARLRSIRSGKIY